MTPGPSSAADDDPAKDEIEPPANPSFPQGISWLSELDYDALIAALSNPAPWEPAATEPTAGPGDTDPDAEPPIFDPGRSDEAALDAWQGGTEVPLPVVAGRVAESLPPGPDLASWLALARERDLEDGALAGVAASYRRLAAWAQAGELATIAEIAARSAAADSHVEVGPDGRPERVPEDASAQVSLALTMSQAAASWWTDLGVTLAWRLSATGAALREGRIDLTRARAIAEATAFLNDEKARQVEGKVLAVAPRLTSGQLRARLRTAVITADPEGAERRRKDAEQRAKVTLYADDDGTAALGGYNLPAIQAAAAMARITALAAALKASGAGGSPDLLRSEVFLGLLLDTLPYIPPPEDDPGPIPPSHGDDPGGQGGTADSGGPGAGDEQGAQGEPGDGLDHIADLDDTTGSDHIAAAEDKDPADTPDSDDPGPPEPAAEDDPTQPGSPPLARPPWDGQERGPDDANQPAPPNWPRLSRPGAGSGQALPATGLSPPQWRAGPTGGHGPPAIGLLHLTLPLLTLTGHADGPGHLNRIGPITAAQARELASYAAADLATRWRVVLVNDRGQAIAVAGVRRRRAGRDMTAAAAPSRAWSPAGQVTVIVSEPDLLDPPAPALPIISQVLTAAHAAAAAALTAAGPDGACSHAAATMAYRPPPGLRDLVAARDVTCRFPTCRQPVWRCDLDHTIPYHRGGRTCSCNLGGLCRFHHQLKQHLLWQLTQLSPGVFQWTTPTGRTYVAVPDPR